MPPILNKHGARVLANGQRVGFPPRGTVGMFLVEEMAGDETAEVVPYIGYPDGTQQRVSDVIGGPAFFAAQRAQGVHWVTDPVYRGGAAMDGATDDAPARDAAIAAIVAAGGGTLRIPKGPTRWATAGAWPGHIPIEVIGAGKNATEIIVDPGVQLFTQNGTPVVRQTTASVSIAEGDLTATLANVVGIAKGHVIAFESTQAMPETGTSTFRSHVAKVKGVAGSVVTLDRPFPIDMTVSGQTVTVRVWATAPGKFTGCTITASVAPYLWTQRGVADLLVENVAVHNREATYQGALAAGGDMIAFRPYGCVDSKFRDCHFSHLFYGVMPTAASHGITVEDCTAYRSRHLYAPTGGTQNFHGRNCNAYSCWAGFDTHQTTYHATHVQCSSFDDEGPTLFRGRNDIVLGCYIDGDVEFWQDDVLIQQTTVGRYQKVWDGYATGQVRGRHLAQAAFRGHSPETARWMDGSTYVVDARRAAYARHAVGQAPFVRGEHVLFTNLTTDPVTVRVRLLTNIREGTLLGGYTFGTVNLLATCRHANTGLFDVIEKQFHLYHRIVATSSVSMPTTAAYTSGLTGQTNESLALTISNVTQSGNTEAGTDSDAHYVEFDVTVQSSRTSPNTSLVLKYELLHTT